MQKVWGVVGCGWLGYPLAKELVNEGERVLGSTTQEGKLEHLRQGGIEPHLLHQDTPAKEKDWLQELDILVLNIPPSSFGDAYAEQMLSITNYINENCKVLFISSTSVYPDLNDEVDEETPATGENRNGPYVRDAESMLIKNLDDRITILRLAGLVGGDRHPVNYLAGRSIKGGEDPINLVHRTDCINVIRNVVKRDYWGETINVCATDHPQKKTYYEKVAEDNKLEKPDFINKSNGYKIVKNNKSKESLGYHYVYDSPFDFPH